jgi:uncharacterized protein (TIGR02611 family)
MEVAAATEQPVAFEQHSKLYLRMHCFCERLRCGRVRHRRRSLLIRAIYAVSGAALLIAGVLMLALPGPAVIVIPIGLALLSLEFKWAESLLDRALAYAASADLARARASTAQRLAAGTGAALLVAAVIAVYVIVHGASAPI